MQRLLKTPGARCDISHIYIYITINWNLSFHGISIRRSIGQIENIWRQRGKVIIPLRDYASSRTSKWWEDEHVENWRDRFRQILLLVNYTPSINATINQRGENLKHVLPVAYLTGYAFSYRPRKFLRKLMALNSLARHLIPAPCMQRQPIPHRNRYHNDACLTFISLSLSRYPLSWNHRKRNLYARSHTP